MKKFLLMLSVASLSAAVALSIHRPASAIEATPIPPPFFDPAAPAVRTTEEIVLSGGCFWGVQGVFQHVVGVRQAISGYAGGEAKTAEYETVSSGTTGHAESVRVIYDPSKISTGKLLQIFFSVAHDPTKLNRQGPDQGTQYRSAIFATDQAQQDVASAYISQLQKANVFARPIVTEVSHLPSFYPAEGYHQNYLTLNPNQPYIAINDLPKVAALKAVFPAEYREQPVLVPLAAN